MKIIALQQHQKLLIEKVRQNNREAQEVLFSQLAPKMLGICRQYINDRQQAEDMLLNGFLKVFNKIESYQFKGDFEAWVRRIMINECLSYLRKHKHLVFVDDMQSFENQITSATTEDDVDDLQRLVDNLPPSWRVIFNLFAVEGYKHQEIADLLGITEMTSRSRYFKAKNQLQKEYLELQNKSHGKGY